MSLVIGLIVEGHGEEPAVPILARRIGGSLDPPVDVRVTMTLRTSRSKLVKVGELERTVEFVWRRIRTSGAIFILLDADDDCLAQLGPQLLMRAKAVRPGHQVGVVLANRE